MPLAEFELVMLDSGEVALQRAEGDETLVTIRFSPDVLAYLDGKTSGCGQEHDGRRY